LFDQAHQVAEGKKREYHTRDAQSRSLWTHGRILAAGFRFVSKNGSSVLPAPNGFGLSLDSRREGVSLVVPNYPERPTFPEKPNR
jgi:hypothetical protein